MATPRYKSVAQRKQVPEGHTTWEIMLGFLALDKAGLLPGTAILLTYMNVMAPLNPADTHNCMVVSLSRNEVGVGLTQASRIFSLVFDLTNSVPP